MKIEWRLNFLLGEYHHRFGKRLTLKQIALETGLSKNTITDIAKGKVKRPDENTVTILLDYLSPKLQRPLTVDDLWHYVATPPDTPLDPLTVAATGTVKPPSE